MWVGREVVKRRIDPHHPRHLIAAPEVQPEKTLKSSLHALRPTERFSNRAEAYRKHRPGYPSAVVDLLRTPGGLHRGTSVGDIGSGTGILTRRLLEAGYDVWGVEPNDAMRQAAEEDLAGFSRFHSVNAAAESTGLPDATFSAITVAQAFHWFEPAAARREFQRLLLPGGLVFIIRNERFGDASPFARDYEALLQDLGESYRAVRHRDHEASIARLRHFFPGETSTAQFDNPQILDWPGLRGRFLSSSYAPAAGEPGHDECLGRLEELYHRHAREGRITLEQKTEVTFGTL